MPTVQIYTTAICPYCVRAKSLLERKGVGYEELRMAWARFDGNLTVIPAYEPT